ncbi:hypothetical protein DACRYDRAFT_22306 [Dacryopinax primogenitus]|uniref:Uncharacterized protein n=1 Tax=Dacryopinax primogenitus (strain DJM 731) TaxID=1858805 RepID=M5G7K5_DACPD|nr:uncharacterized protein DACRYDRAFT_22306 [Dacryopinax primogenitus]EJU01862.1 hypothetical protein DACRYDRAFT_22306 [Dacryopinax primogenitus]
MLQRYTRMSFCLGPQTGGIREAVSVNASDPDRDWRSGLVPLPAGGHWDKMCPVAGCSASIADVLHIHNAPPKLFLCA